MSLAICWLWCPNWLTSTSIGSQSENVSFPHNVLSSGQSNNCSQGTNIAILPSHVHNSNQSKSFFNVSISCQIEELNLAPLWSSDMLKTLKGKWLICDYNHVFCSILLWSSSLIHWFLQFRSSHYLVLTLTKNHHCNSTIWISLNVHYIYLKWHFWNLANKDRKG